MIVLLTAPNVVPGSRSVATQRATSSTHEDGMAATPMQAASANLAISPTGGTAPPASAPQRVLVNFHPLLCRTITDRTARLSSAVRPAPIVLRV